jgi:hypothetical protein
VHAELGSEQGRLTVRRGTDHTAARSEPLRSRSLPAAP